MKIKLISVIVTILTSFLIGFISIEYFGSYGWTVFILIPFFIGFLPVFIVGKRKKLSRNEGYSLSFLVLGLSLLGLLIFAYEGLICIVMVLPIFILLTLSGSYIAYLIIKKNFINNTTTFIALFVSALSFMSFDIINDEPNLIDVKTKIIVNAPIEKVWNNVITFDEIDEPKEFLFKTGIAYPTNATIEGTGVGAIRYCNFTTGSFVEPITEWNAPYSLKFDVLEQPVPITEVNPFWDVHPPHLDGYFRSYKGQFALKEISENKTELEGITFYKVAIQPEFYWKIWSDFIVHKIHRRVLNHIKEVSEYDL